MQIFRQLLQNVQIKIESFQTLNNLLTLQENVKLDAKALHPFKKSQIKLGDFLNYWKSAQKCLKWAKNVDICRPRAFSVFLISSPLSFSLHKKSVAPKDFTWKNNMIRCRCIYCKKCRQRCFLGKQDQDCVQVKGKDYERFSLLLLTTSPQSRFLESKSGRGSLPKGNLELDKSP